MNAILKDLSALSVHERLLLVQDLWDSIAKDSLPPVSDEVHEELRRRKAWADAHPGQGKSLEQIAEKLGVRL